MVMVSLIFADLICHPFMNSYFLLQALLLSALQALRLHWKRIEYVILWNSQLMTLDAMKFCQ